MKKKIVLLSLIVFIIIFSVIIVLSYTHNSKKTSDKNQTKHIELKEKEVNKTIEKNEIEETSEILLTDDDENQDNQQDTNDVLDNKESYTQESNTIPASNTTSNKSDNASSKNNTQTKKENSQTANNSTNPDVTTPKEKVEVTDSKTNDEKIWEEFINDPDTARLLWGHISDYTNSNQAEKKTVQLAELGYAADWVKACTYLSTGEKCVYGIKAVIPYDTCEKNPQMNYEWWKYKNNVDIITYLKSIGYTCQGKSWKY